MPYSYEPPVEDPEVDPEEKKPQTRESEEEKKAKKAKQNSEAEEEKITRKRMVAATQEPINTHNYKLKYDQGSDYNLYILPSIIKELKKTSERALKIGQKALDNAR